MIPFAVPRNNFLLNLNQIVTVTTHPPKPGSDAEPWIEVQVVGGRILKFEGDEARNVNAELNFALTAWRSFQQQATGNGPQIITPGSNGRVL
jgi:hypothetical protein